MTEQYSRIAPVEHRPYWWRGLGDYPQSDVALASRYDAVVVGAGYTGLAAARRLARAGASVAVLDAEQLGHGASTRNGGMVSGVLKWSPSELARRTDPITARSIFDEAAQSVRHLEELVEYESIDCGYRRCGMYFAAYTSRHLAAMRAEQGELARFGVETKVLSPDEGRGEVASDFYHGGKLLSLAGGLHPAALHRGLAHAAAHCGAALIDHCRVTGLKRREGGWDVATVRGRVHADAVIIATNGYTRGGPTGFDRRLIPARSYVIATEDLEPRRVRAIIPNFRMIQDSKNVLYYFRPSPDGRRIVFGGRASLGEIDLDESARRLMGFLRRVFPEAMADVRPAWSWSGSVAFTFDRLPHLGVEDGLHYALGYCGQGVAMACYLGDRVAGRVLAPDVEVSVFQRLPFRGRIGYTGNPWMLPVVGLGLKARDFIDRHVLR